MDRFLGYHSEWNLGSPGGWDYQRITQKIGKAVWRKLLQLRRIDIDLDFDHQLLHPVNGFVSMLMEAHRIREGSNSGMIAVVAEEETLEDVVENSNLVKHINKVKGLSSAIMAPQELELRDGRVCFKGTPVSIIFMDFNTNVLLDLHRKHNLDPLLKAVREGKVINPRGTEPINAKSMFEVITRPETKNLFHRETVRRTPWTRQFYPRRTNGPGGEDITDLIEWTRSNWENLVLKPERGYSGKGVNVGGINLNVDDIVSHALKDGKYIVQEKISLNLWAEEIPELDLEKKCINLAICQTDFRCLFGDNTLYGFLGRFGGVPTNVGSGGGVQPLAVIRSPMSIAEASKRINEAIMNMDYSEVLDVVEYQKKLAMDYQFTYLLGPIKIALRPRLITGDQMKALTGYCAGIWADCLTLEKMWLSGELELRLNMEPEELQIVQSQPWKGTSAIFASDGLFSFGAHVK
ncbi:hypothetical protein ES708_20920 [subsurface metagenome]